MVTVPGITPVATPVAVSTVAMALLALAQDSAGFVVTSTTELSDNVTLAV